MSQFQPPTQPQWHEPQYPPPPETYYPPQQPLMPAPPPKKRMSSASKFALWIIAALVIVSALIIGGIVYAGGQSVQQIQATSTANAVSNNAAVAAGETAISNDQLTQAASTPSPQPTTPVPSPTPQNAIGGSQQSGVWSITINSIKPTVSTNEFEVPKPGNQFILVNFTAQNTSGGAQDMNPFYFTLRDDSGTSYTFTGLTVAANPDGTVVGGQKLRGDLSYEIPKTLHSLVLQFDSPDDFDHSQVVQWNLSV